MIKFSFFLLVVIASLNVTGQQLNIEELKTLVTYDVEKLDGFLLKKNFELRNTNTYSNKTEIEYVQNPTIENRDIGSRFFTYSKFTIVEGSPVTVSYSTLDKNEFIKAKNYLKIKKAHIFDSRVENGTIKTLYKFNGLYVTLISRKSEDSNVQSIWYEIEVGYSVLISWMEK